MYRLISFDGLALPQSASTHTAGSNVSHDGIIRLPGGGYFDTQGVARAPAAYPAPETLHAEFVGSLSSTLLTAYQALMAKRGVYGKLWRLADTGKTQWCWARLSDIPAMRRIPEHRFVQPVDIQFMRESPWHGEEHGASWYLDDGYYFDDGRYLDLADLFVLDTEEKLIPAANAGSLDIDDLILTITAGSDPLTGLLIQHVQADINLRFRGTVEPGKQLIIDCGVFSVTNDGVGAWTDLDEPANCERWMKLLAQTDNVLAIIRTGGGSDATLLLEYSEAWE